MMKLLLLLVTISQATALCELECFKTGGTVIDILQCTDGCGPTNLQAEHPCAECSKSNPCQLNMGCRDSFASIQDLTDAIETSEREQRELSEMACVTDSLKQCVPLPGTGSETQSLANERQGICGATNCKAPRHCVRGVCVLNTNRDLVSETLNGKLSCNTEPKGEQGRRAYICEPRCKSDETCRGFTCVKNHVPSINYTRI